VGGSAVASGNALFGNAGRDLSHARDPFDQVWDFYATKTFPIKERLTLQFRADFFNVFNHPNFVFDNLAIATPAFGVVDNTVGNPRIGQLSLKLQF
jgi:hypothetical protein